MVFILTNVDSGTMLLEASVKPLLLELLLPLELPVVPLVVVVAFAAAELAAAEFAAAGLELAAVVNVAVFALT